MIDETIILKKYNELCTKYENEQIDDFETFVKSRLVEYIFNLCQKDIDAIVELVKKIVDKDEGK